MIVDDADLISRVLARDDRYAFAQLVNKYQSQIRLFLRRLLKGNIEIAEDLAQETFLIAYKKLHTFQGKSAFSSWLYTIAKNLFLQYNRKKQISFSWDEKDQSVEFENDANLKIDLEEAMCRLKPIEAAALSMCYGQDLTHNDVAEILDIPLGTLKTHVNRGRQKLKEILSKTEVTI